ncbi:hypothetical protein WMY93_000261 [Mugilogobius chulae]|uniref:Tumor necrosis factor n=1 Tax=Mugilogobius chulae TaxID=88201 RepID=A0AAW0Q0D3_9GOBI
MVAYSPTPADVERAEHQDHALVLVQTQSWMNRTLKVFGGLFFLALGLAVVFVVVWTWSTRAGTTAAAAAVQPGQTEALFQSTGHGTEPHSTLRKISTKAKAAIHLEGREEGNHSTLQWVSEQGQGFTQGGITLQNNQITIPESGLYFVYSQASFRVSCLQNKSQDSSPQRPLSHRVWRFSESVGSEMSLMNAVRSACSGRGQGTQGWYNAIYLGAVFQLHKGDRLWTETNQLSELETEEGKTFFGVFALF